MEYPVQLHRRERTASVLELQYDFSCYGDEYPPWKQGLDKGKGGGIPVYAMKVHVKVEAWLQSFLTPALDDAEWSASYPDQFTTRGNVPYTLRRLSTSQAV